MNNKRKLYNKELSKGKSGNSSFTIRYNVNNEELEDVFTPSCDDDPPTPHNDSSPNVPSENVSPKKLDKSASILDKYFKSVRNEKSLQDDKIDVPKTKDEEKCTSQKDVNSSPMKEYLNRLGKRAKDVELNAIKEGDDKDNKETWKLFHDFRFKIAQAVEDIKSSRAADDKEKSVPRESSVSDSEENSAVRDSDQQSIGDTDNQVSSLDSSIQNLSEVTQPVTAKVVLTETSLPRSKERTVSESSDDTQKNFSLDEGLNKDACEEDSLDVESGVEALEETNMDGSLPSQPSAKPDSSRPRPDYLTSPLLPPSPDSSRTALNSPKKYFLTFSMIFFTVLLFFSSTMLNLRPMWNGFITGVWAIHFVSAMKDWLLDYLCLNTDQENYLYFKKKQTEPPAKVTYTIPSIKEHKPMKKYEGWINHYRYQEYDPYTYHINKTTTAFMKLEDNNLRISYTRTKISKKAFWDEVIDKVTFYQHRLYNLSGARVILLPKGLVKKRLWSKKYPICVILNEKEKVQVLEKEPVAEKKEGSTEKKTEHDSTENASNPETPKPKRKFIWRRKDRVDTSPDPPRGLRQRISRRMHRDKKTEDASTSTDAVTHVPDQLTVMYEDDYIDSVLESSTMSTKSENNEINENNGEEDIESEQHREFMRIKDFLDEAEELEAGTAAETKVNGEAPTEWSLHVKESGEMQRHLYIFARTGRDKVEWYRRIHTAILEANGEAESKAEQSGSDSSKDNDMSVFKLADKDAIAFAKSTTSAYNVAPEPVAVSWTDETLKTMDLRAHERDFWPYMYKIIQAHQTSLGASSSFHTAKTKKKKKKVTVSKASTSTESEAGYVPAEVAWLNSFLGRITYDAMRNPAVVARIQRRIQRKLSTLKLPSFMGELIATELSLGSTTPLVEVVAGPACDERGVWLDAVVHYEGGAYITLNTQINLMKLKEKKMSLEEQLERMGDTLETDVENSLLKTDLSTTSAAPPPPVNTQKKPAIFDSDLDDSAESSSDEDSGAAAAPVLIDDKPLASMDASSMESGSSAKKFLRMVDKIAKSSYFQQISDYKYVKKAMEGLSNTDIKLHLELKGLEGRLAINLPPPPHDRVWIGFRDNPRIWLKARPALGARAVRFTHITNWIEQRLCKEFEKVLVLPNMEDLVIDIMTPTPVDFE